MWKGVLQGRVLSPKLITVYNAEIPKLDGVMTAHYADEVVYSAQDKHPFANVDKSPEG